MTRPCRWRYPRRSRLWYTALILSAFLHLTGLFLVETSHLGESVVAVYRVRLQLALPRFEPLKPLPAISGRLEAEVPRVTHLGAPGGPGLLPAEVAASLVPSVPGLAMPRPPATLAELKIGNKPDSPVLPHDEALGGAVLAHLPPVAEGTWKTGEREATSDLLRLADRARVNSEHAVVMTDPLRRRELTGYVNITCVRVYGAGLDSELVRTLPQYLQDHTRLLARVLPLTYSGFLSEELLKDPIHFLRQGCGLPTDSRGTLTLFSLEEKALLGRYLRGGGFLFIEGTNRFLREMVDHLAGLLGEEGRLLPVPCDHALYHAYYDFSDGFPGEQRKLRSPSATAGERWYYPSLPDPTPMTVDAGSGSDQTLLGAWGIELNGELIAVLSDLEFCRALFTEARHYINGKLLSRTILPIPQDATTAPAPEEARLATVTNVVVYALTHRQGLTVSDGLAPGILRPAGGRGHYDRHSTPSRTSAPAPLTHLASPTATHSPREQALPGRSAEVRRQQIDSPGDQRSALEVDEGLVPSHPAAGSPGQDHPGGSKHGSGKVARVGRTVNGEPSQGRWTPPAADVS